MSTNTSFQQGQNDAQKGRGPANTSNTPYQTREAYEAGYNRAKNGQSSQK